MKDDSYESIFVEISLPTQKNIICGCIYRHPSSSIADFNENVISPTLLRLSNENKICVLMGDFSINLLHCDNNASISEFYNILCSYYFAPYILQPTRI